MILQFLGTWFIVDGFLNQFDQDIVDYICDDEDIKAVSFVGSNTVSQIPYILVIYAAVIIKMVDGEPWGIDLGVRDWGEDGKVLGSIPRVCVCG